MASVRCRFNKRFQSSQSLIPLCRHHFKVLFYFINRLVIELIQALATYANTVQNSYALEHLKMLRNSLPGEIRTGSKLRNRPALPIAQR